MEGQEQESSSEKLEAAQQKALQEEAKLKYLLLRQADALAK
jgi:hypothetical protein